MEARTASKHGRGSTADDPTIQRLVVLNADVSGSTRLYETHGDEKARADIALCLRRLSAVAALHGGRTLKTIGDEVVCSFASPAQALDAAADMHVTLRKLSAAGAFLTGPIRVKIGCHYGRAEWRGTELVGATPAIAQLVISRARPEEILVSAPLLADLAPERHAQAQFIGTVLPAFGRQRVDLFKLPWEEGDEVTQFRAAPVATAQAHTQLVLAEGPRSLRLDENLRVCRIGRTPDNDFVVAGRYTSRHHAEITFRAGRFYLRDDSINGTLVTPAGARPQRLHREETVLSGGGTLVFGNAPAGEAGTVVSYAAT